MSRWISFAVQHPVTVSMATLASFVFGLVALGRLEARLLPGIHYPSLTVQTELPNTAPADVENLVTRPLEEAVSVIPGLREVRSVSQAGLSRITLAFGWNTDMDYAGLEVREKIDLATLPDDARPPVLLKYDPSAEPVMRIGLWGEASLVATRRLAEHLLKKELESLRGVAAAKISGGFEEEIQVLVDEARLASMGISIEEVQRALAESNVNVSGGRLREGSAEYLLRTLKRFEELEEILDVIVAVRGRKPIHLAEVASVRRGARERTTITHVNGRESVEIALFKEGDANTVEIARRVRDHLADLRSRLPEGTKMEVLFDQSVFIARALREVRNNAILGGLLAVAVLLAFLRDPRSTAVIALAIPLSIVATFVLMYARGVSLNVMSLGGLALGVGMLVDNSIVVLESIHRRRERHPGEDPRQCAASGASEVATAVTASTLTTVAVFVPIAFVIEGITGQIFRDQALTVTFALLVSLAVSLTFTPAFAALGRRRRERTPPREASEEGLRHWRELIPGGRGPRWLRAAPVFVSVAVPVRLAVELRRASRALSRALGRAASPLVLPPRREVAERGQRYERVLAGALRRRGHVLGVLGAFAALAVFLALGLGTELLPPLAQGSLTLTVELPEGTPLSRTSREIARLGREILAQEGVELVAAEVGVSADPGRAAARLKENRGDLRLRLLEATRDLEARVLEEVRQSLGRRPRMTAKLRRPSLRTLRAPIEIDVYGTDLDLLAQAAQRVAAELARVHGARDIQLSLVPGSPEIRITFDRDKLAQLGLRLSAVSKTVRGKLRGVVASRFHERDHQVDIRVRNRDEQSGTLAALRQVIVTERNGIPVRLGAVARLETVPGPAEIHRLGGQRVAIISANLAGRDLGSATQEISARLRGLPMPAGVRAELGGQNDEMRASFRSLWMTILLAIFLVYLVMASQFESFIHPFIIMFTVPLALMGAVFGLVLTHTPVSIVAGIGAVMLSGIVVNNGIVLVDRILRLQRRGLAPEEAVMTAGRERLRPILMTTATTVLGLTPMALGLGEGAELRAPLAVTVISGLLLATVLTLFVVPIAHTLLAGAGGATREARVPLPSDGAPQPLTAPSPPGTGS